MERVQTTSILCLALLWPHVAHADVVTDWSARAGKAAIASCLIQSGNGLVESRMYAMTHVAIHDAMNAIDRRPEPYAFDARASSGASIDAAVAAAAHDVLVAV